MNLGLLPPHPHTQAHVWGKAHIIGKSDSEMQRGGRQSRGAVGCTHTALTRHQPPAPWLMPKMKQEDDLPLGCHF